MPRKGLTTVSSEPREDRAIQVEVTLPVRRGRHESDKCGRPSSASHQRSCPRIPRITRLMALAIKFQEMLDRGEVRNYADLARLGYVSRARVTQIMNLLLLAPDVQTCLIDYGDARRSRSAITERDFRKASRIVSWVDQRQMLSRIAALIRQALGLTSKAVTAVPSRIWLLGRQRTENGYWELFLMRGLCWPDGVQMLTQCVRVQQSPAPIVVVPYRLPPGESATRPWPIRTLSEIVSLDGSRLVVDLASLTTAVGAVGISHAASGKQAPRIRMSRSLGTPAAVNAAVDYMQSKGLTETKFGNQFETTDRTLRNFLQKGKMRRANFEAMATTIGVTVEQLLRGELPPSIKRSTRQ